MLLHETYSRIPDVALTIAADCGTHAAGRVGPNSVLVPLPLATADWGVVRPSALAHHIEVARKLRAAGADRRSVVHCARALPEGIAAWLNRRWGGAPYVVWAHGEDVANAAASRELTFVMKRVYGGAAAVVANSRNTRSLLEDIGLTPDRIHLVYPGVDAARFHPHVDGRALRSRLAPHARTLLLSVGRLQRRKGHDHAIAALAALAPGLPGLQYLIVGDGEERARLEALAAELRVTERVIFAGEIPAGDLPACYAASDIFLLPNRMENGDVEGFGIVFLEAAAAGRPAIGGRSGGVPEAIVDGVTGLLVSGDDIGALSAALARLIDDAVLRHRLAAAGRARVLASFTWEAAAQRIAGIHLSVAEAHS